MHIFSYFYPYFLPLHKYGLGFHHNVVRCKIIKHARNKIRLWFNWSTQLEKYNEPFHSQDLISNSPYCLQYNSYDVGLENLVFDQLTIPKWYFTLFSPLVRSMLYWHWMEKFCLGHSWEWDGWLRVKPCLHLLYNSPRPSSSNKNQCSVVQIMPSNR